jgi:hypothetical protein
MMSTCAEIFGLELARSTVISWSVWLVLVQLAARLDFVEVDRCKVVVLSPILFNIFLLGKLTVVTSGLLLSRWRWDVFLGLVCGRQFNATFYKAFLRKRLSWQMFSQLMGGELAFLVCKLSV